MAISRSMLKSGRIDNVMIFRPTESYFINKAHFYATRLARGVPHDSPPVSRAQLVKVAMAKWLKNKP